VYDIRVCVRWICHIFLQIYTRSICHTYARYPHICKISPHMSHLCVRYPHVCQMNTPHIRPTQSIMYVPLQVNRFRKSVLLIVQYKYLKSCSGDFYSQESDPPHKIMRYWLYYSICWFFHFHLTESVRWKWFVLAVYHLKIASRRGRTLIIFTWFIGAGGFRRI